MTTVANPTGHDNIPFDASGNARSGWVHRHGTPNLLQEYYTCGGWAPHLVGTTSYTKPSTGETEIFRETDREDYDYPATELPDFNGTQSYVIYGDGILKKEHGDSASYPIESFSEQSLWENGPGDLRSETNTPSGMHHTYVKLEDITPSGTVYEVDIWSNFTKDMTNLAETWGSAFVGASLADLEENGPSVATSTIEGWKNAVASSGSSNPNPPLGYVSGEGLGIELENITFIDLAMSQEGVGLGADGVGYTLNSFWLKFPVILGPSGVL
jgi:hypothetical protein